MPGLLVKGRSLVRLGRALVVASEACRERCCGPAPDHLYCLLCPCNYVGCWPDHPPIWVRDDVVCPLPPGVPPGTYQPAICKYGGAVKVTRAGRSWCYMPAGSLGITRRRDQIPP